MRLRPVQVVACVWLLGLGGSTGLVCAAPPPTLFESSFETGEIGTIPDGWTRFSASGTVAISDAQAHAGKRALHLQDGSTKDAVGVRTPHIPVTPGADYWAQWWYLAPAGESGSFYVEFWDKDGKRIESDVHSVGCNASGKWERQSVTVAAPASAVSATLLPYSSSNTVADAYYDDIAFGEGIMETYDRTPQPPAQVKHPCGLYREADIQRAKENIARHAWAKGVLAGFKSSADWWLKLPDDQIPFWVPELTPINGEGLVGNCPKCDASCRTDGSIKYLPDGGAECTRCHTVFPNADYPENGREMLRNPLGQNVEYTFHQDAAGKRHRLSGLCRFGRTTKLNQLGAMGKYYALTGDKAYAEKAVKVLRRLAQVYPGYIPADWERFYRDYSNLQSGKLAGWKLYDAGTFLQLAICYDLIYDSGCLTEEDKTLIENGAFREAVRLFVATSPKGCCINDGPYAMACGAMLGVLLGDRDAITWAISPPDGFLGFVHRYFFRDGHWEDGSFSYESMALGPLYATPEILQGYSDPPTYTGADRYDNLDLRSDPVIRKVYVAPLYVLLPDRTGPTLSDSTLGAKYSSRHAETNNFWYPTERNQRLLSHAYGGKCDDAGDEYALFRRPPDVDFARVEPLDLAAKSLVRPGVGWAILRTGPGPDAAALYIKYGVFGSGHCHPDKLSLLYYDNRTELITDLGYLGWGHPNRPWMQSALAHNAVLLDGQPPARGDGELLAFQTGDMIQSMVAQGRAVYAQAERYERNLTLIDRGLGQRYLVDVFRVTGGKQHDYVIHGAGPAFTRPPGQWAEFAGEVVAPAASAGGKWLSLSERAEATGGIAAEWRDGADGVRLDLLGQVGTSMFHLVGPGLRERDNPWGKRDLHILLARRPGPQNTFTGVVQAMRGRASPLQVLAEPVQTETGQAQAVRVKGDAFEDVVVIGDAESARGLSTCGTAIAFRGQQAFYGTSAQERAVWLMNGSELRIEGLEIKMQPVISGKVTEVDEKSYSVKVDTGLLPPGNGAQGQQLLAKGLPDGAYEIESVQRLSERESLVRLADEPILNLKPGQEFSFGTHCLLRSLGHGLLEWQSCVPCEMTIRATAGPEGFVAIPGGEKPATLYLRTLAGSWQTRDVERREDGYRIRLDPAELGATRALLLFTDRPIDVGDVQPPALVRLEVGGVEAKVSGADLGFVPEAGSMAFDVSDASGLAVESVRASLSGRKTGPAPLHADATDRTGGLWRINLRPDAPLPEDDYRLDVGVADTLANAARFAVGFNTLGRVVSFLSLPVVASSGQASKPVTEEIQFYRASEAGHYVTYEFDVADAGTYTVSVLHATASSYGRFQVSLDGKPAGEVLDGYSSALVTEGGRVRLDVAELAAGKHRLEFRCVGKNEKSTDCFLGLVGLVLRPARE